MLFDDFKKPKRVWINSPSTLQPYHKWHGKVGIAIQDVHKSGAKDIVIYFTEGDIHSMIINPLYLDV